MFKVKYKVWVGLIVLSFVLNFAVGIVPAFFAGLFEEYPVSEVYIQSSQNPNIKNQLINLSGNDISLKFVNSINENTQAIITDIDNSSLNISGYEKIPNAINTPIVLFANRQALSKEHNFTSSGTGNNNALTKDLYDILSAMENDKKWEDIGIGRKVATGNVSLVIPKKNSVGYNAVVETIYLTLSQGKTVLTASDVESLTKRVNNILSKCTEVEDIGRYIINKWENSNRDVNALILGPEFIVIDKPEAFGSDSSDWMPIYLNKTSNISLDLYVKGEYSENVKKTFSSQGFTKLTGMRAENRNYKIASNISGFYGAIEVVEIGQIDADAKAKIRNNVYSPVAVEQTKPVETKPVESPKVETKVEESKPSETKVEETKETDTTKVEGSGTEETKEESQEQTQSESNEESETSNQGGVFDFFFIMLIIFVVVLMFLIGLTVF